MARKALKPLFATIIERHGVEYRSSFFYGLEEAIEYAERMMGIIRVESIEAGAVKTVWSRNDDLV